MPQLQTLTTPPTTGPPQPRRQPARLVEEWTGAADLPRFTAFFSPGQGASRTLHHTTHHTQINKKVSKQRNNSAYRIKKRKKTPLIYNTQSVLRSCFLLLTDQKGRGFAIEYCWRHWCRPAVIDKRKSDVKHKS
ncbi:hypothetical protein E2C01_020253 [Portunus trituberculatus]|uniref:Uncharacterized protein n=1 Tax=Portunus trituberculatus TaxID=210409 RepID=A0A5B7E1S6_PORTR|nr:hypothetical protein [Portunus trituberculatus]